MSEPSASWTATASSGREGVGRAVEVTAERDPVVVHDPQVPERHDLEAARVGEDRTLPVHEPMEAAEPRDPLMAGSQVEVVGVRQDDRGACVAQVVGVERLDGCVGPHRHELRRVAPSRGRGAVRRAAPGSTRPPAAAPSPRTAPPARWRGRSRVRGGGSASARPIGLASRAQPAAAAESRSRARDR